jgi:hypothetical protein
MICVVEEPKINKTLVQIIKKLSDVILCFAFTSCYGGTTADQNAVRETTERTKIFWVKRKSRITKETTDG